MAIDFDKEKVNVPLKLIYAGLVAFAGWWIMQQFMPLVERVNQQGREIATLQAQRSADQERMNRHESLDDEFKRNHRGP